MAVAASQAQVEAAAAYEELFVASLFRDWALRVADAAKLQAGDRVLDVACGTGALTREIVRRVGPSGSVAGVDPGAGMVAVAAQQAPEADFHEGTAEALPFPDRSFDAVVSQFGLMFFTDQRQAIAEMLRVLVPGGRLAVAVWDGLDSMPAFADEVKLLDRMAGKPAGDALRLPFVLGDRRRLGALFEGAGVADVAVATRRGKADFPGVRTMIEADLRGWLPLVGIDLTEETIQATLDEAERALAHHVTTDGRAVFPTSAHIVTGRRA